MYTKTGLWITVDKFRMGFLFYGMEISLVQLDVSLFKISLLFQRNCVSIIYINVSADLYVLNRSTTTPTIIWTAQIVLENAYIQVTIFHGRDLCR